MERFKALAAKWRKQSADYLREADEKENTTRGTAVYAIGETMASLVEQLEITILATENQAFMESIVPGFKDLDDVVATDAANSVMEQTCD